jgi:hypothetical protein
MFGINHYSHVSAPLMGDTFETAKIHIISETAK